MLHRARVAWIFGLTFTAMVMASCNAHDNTPAPWRSKARAGKMLFAFDEKGRPINEAVYRTEYPVGFGFNDEIVLGQKDKCEEISNHFFVDSSPSARTSSVIISGTRLLVFGSFWSKYYEELAVMQGPKRSSRYRASAFGRGLCGRTGALDERIVKVTDINFLRVSSLPTSSVGTSLSGNTLIASYSEKGRTLCRIEVTLDGIYIRHTQVTYASSGRYTPTLQEPVQLACIHRGVMVTAGYFGYLTMPAKDLINPKEASKHRSPVYTQADFRDPEIAHSMDGPFNPRGLTGDTDELKGLLADDDVPPGFRYSDLAI